MRRRDFIKLSGSAAAAWPLAARAQHEAMPVIGFLQPGSNDESTKAAFRKGLAEVGFTEGVNVTVEYYWTGDRNDRLSQMLADLVRRQVSVIATSGGPVALAAKAATSTIPIVFFIGIDPVETGLVTTLNHPGQNLTGVTNLGVELGPKRIEILHTLLPTANSLAVLVNPKRPNVEQEIDEFRNTARGLGLQLQVLRAGSEAEIEALFPSIRSLGVAGLVIAGDPFFNAHGDYLGALSLRYTVPSVYQNREFTAAGGLMSYGASRYDLTRQLGVYAGRVLKGEKPANLPVEQAAKIELIINLKTAKALGLTFPLTLLGRADEVIE